MAVDFWADKYWNGQYFNVQYFGTGEQVEGAISGSAHGTSTATGTLSNGAATAEIVPIGAMYGARIGKRSRPFYSLIIDHGKRTSDRLTSGN
jgi:hypothetical protein